MPGVPTGMQCWFKADAIVGKIDLDPISNWPDSGNQGLNAIQAVGANQPLYRTGILNGLPVVRFDGVNDVLKTPNFSMGPCTIISAIKLIADVSATDVSLWGHTDDVVIAREVLRRDLDGFLRSVVIRAPGLSEYRENISFFNWLDGRFHNIALTYNGTHATHIPLRSGQRFLNLIVNSAVEPGAAADNILLSLGAVAAQFANCDIAEIVAYNRVLTVIEVNSISEYFRTKYGLPNATSSIFAVASAAGGGGAPGPGASILVAKPVGTVNGDRMVANSNINIAVAGEPAITPPVNWIQIGARATNGRVISISWERIANAEPADYTWTFAPALDQGATITITTMRNVPAASAVLRQAIAIGTIATPTTAWGRTYTQAYPVGYSYIATSCDGLVGGTPTWIEDAAQEFLADLTGNTNEFRVMRGSGMSGNISFSLTPSIAKTGWLTIFQFAAAESSQFGNSKIKRLRR